jgi:uncharacterized protein YbgA (DUF1722 family)
MTEYVDKKWNQQYEKLVGFKRKNGHCNVPRGYMEDVSLGKWVGTQRGLHANNKLRLDRKELLEEIGFAWKADKTPHLRTDDPKWNKQYEKLVEFKRNNGHCIVPQTHHEDMSLGMWVSQQRHLHSKNKLRADRKELLNEIGFVWRVDTTSAPWNKQYEKLIEFKRKNGHCLVPSTYKEDMSLGTWVSKQRQFHNQNTIRLDRKDLLDEIGFVWKAPGVIANYKNNERNWHQQYEKLVEFKRKNGNCLVPQKYQEDASLGHWVGKQRQAHVNNNMRQDRKGLLDEIGFVWKAETGAAARSSTTNVSGLVIASFITLNSGYFSHSRACSAFCF